MWALREGKKRKLNWWWSFEVKGEAGKRTRGGGEETRRVKRRTVSSTDSNSGE